MPRSALFCRLMETVGSREIGTSTQVDFRPGSYLSGVDNTYLGINCTQSVNDIYSYI